MSDLPAEWLPLCAAVFALGVRHGLDPDHLAMIDGLTRFNMADRPQLARWCGALFSGGHGCVVVTAATVIGGAAARAAVPAWTEGLGIWVSIGFLLGLGSLNAALVLQTPPDAMVRPAGLTSRLLARLTRTTHPPAIVAIGMLFAVSFDTLSQALLFTAAADRVGGAHAGLELGLLFTLGMLLVDGLNGLWISALLRRADRRARIASRAIGGFVAVLSFAVAALEWLRYLDRRVDALFAPRETLAGLLIVAAAALGITALGRLPRRPAAETSPDRICG